VSRRLDPRGGGVIGNLLYGLATMLVCLLLQAVLLVAVVRYYGRRRQRISAVSIRASFSVLMVVMVMLVAGNLLQAAAWATLFRLLGEFASFEEAYYHSMVNFATLGYGDVVMSDERKLLGPLEAVNGVVMIGVTTSVLLAVIQDLRRRAVRARRS
jgi:hypothetical protein